VKPITIGQQDKSTDTSDKGPIKTYEELEKKHAKAL